MTLGQAACAHVLCISFVHILYLLSVYACGDAIPDLSLFQSAFAARFAPATSVTTLASLSTGVPFMAADVTTPPEVAVSAADRVTPTQEVAMAVDAVASTEAAMPHAGGTRQAGAAASVGGDISVSKVLHEDEMRRVIQKSDFLAMRVIGQFNLG